MNILYTAFKGKTNSSKLLLDSINSNNKLYLTNSFKTSVYELEKELSNNKYDLIISFGQAPLESNTIKIETIAREKDIYKTTYNYNNFKKILEKHYTVIISKNAGNYLCNNIYYYGLKYIYINKLKTEMIFVHIPKKYNQETMNKLLEIINKK